VFCVFLAFRARHSKIGARAVVGGCVAEGHYSMCCPRICIRARKEGKRKTRKGAQKGANGPEFPGPWTSFVFSTIFITQDIAIASLRPQ
jgi:hypothetical protein